MSTFLIHAPAAPLVNRSPSLRGAMVLTLLAAALVGLFGFLSYRGSREHVLATWRETLEHDATTTILRVQSAAQEAARDALFAYISRLRKLMSPERIRARPAYQRALSRGGDYGYAKS